MSHPYRRENMPVQLDPELRVLELFREDLVELIDLAQQAPKLILACVASAH